MLKRFFNLAAAGLLGLALAACATQADTPTKKLALAKTAYAEALDISSALGEAGKLSVAAADKIESARQVARLSIDQAERLIAEDAPGAFFYVTEAYSLATRLLTIVREFKSGAETVAADPPDRWLVTPAVLQPLATETF